MTAGEVEGCRQEDGNKEDDADCSSRRDEGKRCKRELAEECRAENGVDAQQMKVKLFDVFRRPSKSVYLVRHGHTRLKKYLEPSGTKLESSLFDVPLTKWGMEQAVALGPKLAALNAGILICSPLTRALQTLEHALPALGNIPYQISQIHAESVQVSGDIGRPPQELGLHFPRFQFTDVEEVWWYSDPAAPNDSTRGLFQKREPAACVTARIGRFRRFLASRPESAIIVIGHSSFFMALSGTKTRLANCEWQKIRL